jgi:UDP-N-acetylglucosamine 2-epimerase
MAPTKKVAVVFGTRPEAIKLCPVVLAMHSRAGLAVSVCVSAQHREMLDQVLRTFEVRPDVDLDVMSKNQTLAALTSRIVALMDNYLVREAPDLLVVQGDTTTTFCAALAAFYRRVPVAHVEAGLRTGNLASPFPEELNRILTTRLATHHFAPTSRSRENLLKDGVPPEAITVSGNTVIDALNIAVARARREGTTVPGLPRAVIDSGRPIVLVTGHRRENFGAGFEGICKAIRDLAHRFPHVSFVYPVHLNPNVREPVFRVLGGLGNVHLLEPLDYLPFVRLMDAATLVLTDSGGIQEEAPTLKKPVLVMRDTTERPEVLDAGVARLVGTDPARIASEVVLLLTNPEEYARMAIGANPYGDGTASLKIAEVCERMLS